MHSHQFEIKLANSSVTIFANIKFELVCQILELILSFKL